LAVARVRKNRDEERKRIKAEHDAQADDRAAQAEARLKFLLSQSDLFAHFGAGKAAENIKKKEAEFAAKNAMSSSSCTDNISSPGASRRDRRASTSILDEEEQALLDGADSETSTLVPVTCQPTIINGKMRHYQIEGLSWMVRLSDNGISGILADEMGLGKTLQSISVLAFMREYRNIPGPHLVIVPKSTLSNWINEFKNWCPVFNIVKFHGAKEDREDMIQHVFKKGWSASEETWDVVITTYEVANKDRNAISKVAWRYLIIDEAHRLKNETSQFSQTVRMLSTQNRLLLTGT
jgi:SWI/SNF-related matrix-associated actin-dependent regulator of chromatin subfamily A member 5